MSLSSRLVFVGYELLKGFERHIADSFACGHHAVGERGFTDDLSRPKLIKQLLFGAYALVMLKR
jgi:hypothetical protein